METVKLLVNSENVNRINQNGRPLLEIAINSLEITPTTVDVVRVLIENGADVHWTDTLQRTLIFQLVFAELALVTAIC